MARLRSMRLRVTFRSKAAARCFSPRDKEGSAACPPRFSVAETSISSSHTIRHPSPGSHHRHPDGAAHCGTCNATHASTAARSSGPNASALAAGPNLIPFASHATFPDTMRALRMAGSPPFSGGLSVHRFRTQLWRSRSPFHAPSHGTIKYGVPRTVTSCARPHAVLASSPSNRSPPGAHARATARRSLPGGTTISGIDARHTPGLISFSTSNTRSCSRLVKMIPTR